MNIEIRAEAALFPEKEYTLGIFVAVWDRREVIYWCIIDGCHWMEVV
jgi:hypothetical protein